MVDPHGAISRDAQDSLLIDSAAIVTERHVVHRHEESERRTERRLIKFSVLIRTKAHLAFNKKKGKKLRFNLTQRKN